jgi:hypothetical protein
MRSPDVVELLSDGFVLLAPSSFHLPTDAGTEFIALPPPIHATDGGRVDGAGRCIDRCRTTSTYTSGVPTM